MSQKRSQPRRKVVNTRLPEEVIQRWHIFAAENKLNKEQGLEELINRGSKCKKLAKDI